MKKPDDYVNKQIKAFIPLLFFSLFFFAIAILILKTGENWFVTIFCFGLGVVALILDFKLFIGACIKKKQIKRALKFGTKVIATIDETKYSYPVGVVAVCSSEINGTRYKFISGPISFDIEYACKELGVEGLTVYVNMNNPKEYIVDISEIENRVVDLSNVRYTL